MAAVTKVNPSLATPTGEARIRRGLATVAIKKGQAVKVSTSANPGNFQETAWALATSAAEAIGIAIKDAAVNATVEVVIDGEIGGFEGLPKGTFLDVASGELQDTAPADGAHSRFYAYSDTVVMVL